MQTLEHSISDGVMVKRRIISLADTDPLSFIPHGDRLLVEVLELDETTASGIKLVRTDDAGKEHEVGWSAGVVINVGSGHRLDTPDQAVALHTKAEVGDVGAGPLKIYDDVTQHGIVMVPSTVPMPFFRTQVIMLAKYSGSDIILRGMPFKVITQAHVLGVFSKMRLDVDGYYAEQSG